MRYLLVSVIISIGIGLFGCKQEQNAGENTSLPQHVQVRNVIIDADTDNELDDLLAIAAALKSPKLEVIGMTAVQWDGRNNTVREGHDPWWNDNSCLYQLADERCIGAIIRPDRPPVANGK